MGVKMRRGGGAMGWGGDGLGEHLRRSASSSSDIRDWRSLSCADSDCVIARCVPCAARQTREATTPGTKALTNKSLRRWLLQSWTMLLQLMQGGRTSDQRGVGGGRAVEKKRARVRLSGHWAPDLP
jgi:hypothetical protein